MFNKGFYPTDTPVIEKMLEDFKKGYKPDLSNFTVLEPSAGSGAILDYITNEYKCKPPAVLHCIEIEPELQSILIGKNANIVHDDFLTFAPALRYDLILMNPPFHEGVKHILKAWETLESGIIKCLLNSETINNPHTRDRQVLKEIITEHGKAEELGQCFKDAPRTTNVNVTLVTLKKTASRQRFDFDAKTGNLEFPEDIKNNQVQVRDTLKSYEQAYLATINAFKDAIQAYDKFRYAKSVFHESYSPTGKKYLDLIGSGDFSEFIKKFNSDAWETILKRSNFESYLTSKVKKDFTEKFANQKEIAFTKQNMQLMFDALFLNKDDILLQCVDEVFDTMTKYYKENRFYPEGWKTNDKYKVNRKVIHPRFICRSYDGSFDVNYHFEQELKDIDRAMCYLLGKKMENIETIHSALKSHFKLLGCPPDGHFHNETESEFFEIKFFKKGTLHLYFKDKFLWETFNITVAKHRKWIGN